MADRQKILIVDDKKENLFALEKVLAPIGAEILSANSGNEALKLSLRHDFALAIFDVQMPEMDGYELAELFQSGERSANVPIIFLTAAHFDETNIYKGYNSGAVDYITKPYNPEILCGKARVFLKLDEQKKELERLNESALLRYESVFSTVSDAILLFDSETKRFIDVNAAALKLYQFSRSEFLGMDIRDITNEPVASDASVEQLNIEGHAHIALRWHKKKDGTVFPVEISGDVFQWNGRPAICAVVRDITDRIHAEEAARKYVEQDKLATVGKVAGKMAHDFNNLLGIIVGTSDLLKTMNLHPEFASEIGIIKESALKGRDLTRNLLFFAKDQDIKLSRFDLNKAISLLVKSMKSDLSGIEVALEFASEAEEAFADQGLLENALINMIQNSIHALSKTAAPKLSLRTSTGNNCVFIEVRDNGCGIPAEYRDSIYEPAVTLKGSADRSGAYRRDVKGSGYGMANVKRCVEKHGGSIDFESRVGEGTTFKISLPFVKGDFSPEEIETIRKQKIVEGKRILIIEDEPQLGRILRAALETFKHKVDQSSDGREALKLLRDNAYDIVSVDFSLPDMSGMDIYKKIRETNADVPIVFVSGNFEFMESMIILKEIDGRVDHLAKPFSNVDYANKLHEWL